MLQHALVEGVLGLVNARRIQEGELGLAAIDHAQDLAPGGLGRLTHGRQFLAPRALSRVDLPELGCPPGPPWRNAECQPRWMPRLASRMNFSR